MGIRLSLKTVLKDCIIMLCGTVLGILLAQGFMTRSNKIEENVSHLAKRYHICPMNPMNEKNINKNYSQKFSNKQVNSSKLSAQQLYIGIATTKMPSSETIAAINSTWGRNVPTGTLEFLLTYNAHRSTICTQGLSVVTLNRIENTLSPQEKVYRMLCYLHDYHINKYNWFMLSNEDVYIRVESLLPFLSKLDSTKKIFIGQVENDNLTLHNHHCMAWPGVIFSRSFLKYLVHCLGKYLQDVSEKDIVPYNEAFKYCIGPKFGAQYTWIKETSQLFLNETRLSNKLDTYNNRRLQQILMIHSLQNPSMMYRIHHFYTEMETNNSMTRRKGVFKHPQIV